MDLLFNSSLTDRLRLQASVLCADIVSSAHPAQLKAMADIVARIMRHQICVQQEADRVGQKAHSRVAEEAEAKAYIELASRLHRGKSLGREQQRTKDKMEQEVSLKELALLRQCALEQIQLQAKEEEEEQQRAEAEAAAEKQPATAAAATAGPLISPRKPSTWDSVGSFFSEVSKEGERTASSIGGAAVAVGGTAASAVTTGATAAASAITSSIGSIQAALSSATPFELAVQLELVAEAIQFVLFENANKIEQSALLALEMKDAAARVQTEEGGELGVKAWSGKPHPHGRHSTVCTHQVDRARQLRSPCACCRNHSRRGGEGGEGGGAGLSGIDGIRGEWLSQVIRAASSRLLLRAAP